MFVFFCQGKPCGAHLTDAKGNVYRARLIYQYAAERGILCLDEL